MREAAKTTGEMMGHPSLPLPVPPRSISPLGGDQPEHLHWRNPAVNHRSESVLSKKEVHNYLLQNTLV